MKTRCGFSLIEATIALTLSSLLVVLIATVFLVQSRAYATQAARGAVQETVRGATALVAEELRGASQNGVLVAQPDSLVIRSTMLTAAVCGVSGYQISVHFEGGVDDLDQGEVAGFGVQNPSTLNWTFYNAAWSDFDGGVGSAASRCASNGADTVGISGEFRESVSLPVSLPAVGDLISVFRQTTYTVRPSALRPGTWALYRAVYGSPPVEVVSDLKSSARFQYRLRGLSGLQDQVGSLQVGQIDAVRFIVNAERSVAAGGTQDSEFGWPVTIPLRHAR